MSDFYTIDPTVSIRPDWIKEWMDDAHCKGRWEDFDSSRIGVAKECWSHCKVRVKCLLDALNYEASVNAHYPIDGFDLRTNDEERTGIRGGYTPREREYIFQIVVTSDDPEPALYQFI